ncbi:probable monofunctional riboflavin biosynthesis protein RIBA 3, chloroplastic isoform X1 [Hordeum vulgare subsp. vulgare]|uniref:GTP cyclohydrolase II n=2 Tax=Hordeum vulgare subsp. vulgare TaxID=112509 RepID=F2E715_HORVV|nr:probable monofunctional riboflavin biosynthesis protein RIBA 3, chloroplastic isoform X1 [Hordeum vulgare subsp. vulgare]BAK03137.1 predicted protein [Hordeum vulgare subsp. vulgare]
MDCVLLSSHSPSYNTVNARLQQCSVSLNSVGFAVIRKGCLSLRCYAIGDAGRRNDPLNENKNGPISQELNGPSASFTTVGAEITQETGDFFVSDAEGDPDKPTDGFSSIEDAINSLREGKFVIAIDDENGDNVGDLVMAADLASPESIAFMIRNGSGIISVGMKEADLERLMLPMMSPVTEIGDISAVASTVTVDARVGISTGVSAADRAKTILALASPDSKPSDLRRPGHIFPLKYRDGGVLKRAGHTEASVDLVALAGLRHVSVLSSIIDPKDGSMASTPALKQMALEHDIPIVSIADLIRYRRKREKLVELIAVSRLPTKWGLFRAYCYQSKLDGTEHIAVAKGDIGDGEDVLVRVHSECLTGDILGSARCDCGEQLDLAMQLIEKSGRGVLVYLRGHEGRGIGLGQKLRAYNLQDQGSDTVEANVELGLAIDSREYGIGAQILRDIGVRTMRLMTNNPAKFVGLKGYGLAVVGRVPVISPITKENQKYLETKRTKMGHLYGSDLPGGLLKEFLNPTEDNATN